MATSVGGKARPAQREANFGKKPGFAAV
jgi:hypothetical protein